MAVRLVRKMHILDDSLESLILKEIGDGNTDVFIEENSSLKELICNELENVDLGNIEVDGIPAQKKVGIVYLTQKSTLIENSNKIYNIAPSFNTENVQSIEHITVHNQLNLIVTDENNRFELNVVTYVEAK